MYSDTRQIERPANVPGRSTELWIRTAAFAYFLFVIYGSLVPFRFKAIDPAEAFATFLRMPYLSLGLESRADWVANILLFIPLVFLALCVLGVRRRPSTAIQIGVVLAGILLCIVIEFTQVFFPPRSVTLNDIIAESLGSAIGWVAWRAFGRQALDWFATLDERVRRDGAAAQLMYAYLAILAFYAILPLDLSLSLTEIYRKWASGKVILIPFGSVFSTTADAIYGLATDALIWIPVGALARIAAWGSPPRIIGRAAVVAAVLEFAQLFVFTRTVDVTDIVMAVVGTAAGVAIGDVVDRRLRADRAGDGSRLAAVGLFGWGLFLMLLFWFPFAVRWDLPWILDRVTLMFSRVPLETYYYSSEYRAVTELLHKTIFFVPWGFLLAWPARGSSRLLPKANLGIAGWLAVVALPLAIELGQTAMPGKVADWTDWLLGVLGGALGAFGWRVLPLLRAPSRIVDPGLAGNAPPAGNARSPAPFHDARRTTGEVPAGERLDTGRRDSVPVTHRQAGGQTTARNWRRALVAFAVLFVGIWLATHLPWVPYNLRKLVDTSFPAGSLLGLLATMCWIAVLPAIAASGLAQPNTHRLLRWPAGLVVCGIVAWAVLRVSITREMLQKVTGSPVLDWPADLEEVARFTAFTASLYLFLTGGAIVAMVVVLRGDRRWVARIAWIMTALVVAPVLYWAIVVQAGTDNIVELMEGGGSPRSAALLAAYLVLVGAGGSALSMLRLPGARSSAFVLLIAVGSGVLGYLALAAGLEDVLVKYGKVFSGMQFLLSQDRESYAQPPELVMRFAVAHCALTVAVALGQRPFWALSAANPESGSRPQRSRSSHSPRRESRSRRHGSTTSGRNPAKRDANPASGGNT